VVARLNNFVVYILSPVEDHPRVLCSNLFLHGARLLVLDSPLILRHGFTRQSLVLSRGYARQFLIACTSQILVWIRDYKAMFPSCHSMICFCAWYETTGVGSSTGIESWLSRAITGSSRGNSRQFVISLPVKYWF